MQGLIPIRLLQSRYQGHQGDGRVRNQIFHAQASQSNHAGTHLKTMANHNQTTTLREVCCSLCSTLSILFIFHDLPDRRSWQKVMFKLVTNMDEVKRIYSSFTSPHPSRASLPFVGSSQAGCQSLNSYVHLSTHTEASCRMSGFSTFCERFLCHFHW